MESQGSAETSRDYYDIKMNKILQKNVEYSERYHQKIGNTQIPEMISELISKIGIKRIVDLGCGDGEIILAIDNKYKNKRIIGIDISPRRIKNLKKKYPNYKFFCRDVIKTALPSKHFDLAISTQVIEHLEDDCKLLEEVFRLLKPKGYFYISSVIKKPWAIYKYRNLGKFVLDPTHIYEYKSKEEFLNLLRKYNFKILKFKIYLTKRKFFGLEIPIFGFYIIEVLCQK